ncbi:hypothetical protein FQN54_003430 [Arachnomyces sp. PD_36]|nr:hypothetical protein FQN54_003430 [Arachnomyces sp. PD_36]
MASPEITSAISSIESNTTAPSKQDLYTDLLSHIISTAAADADTTLSPNLTAFLDSILSDNLGVVTSRLLLDEFIKHLPALPAQTKITVSQHALTTLQTRSTSIEEQDANIREILAEAYESQEEYISAAKALQGIHLDSSQRLISDDIKARMWIRIVRLYLEEDDTTNAEAVLNRIKALPSKIIDPELKLHFQLSQARILDARRKFLDASQEYLNVSLAAGVDEGDRLHALSAAITCAVLAPAGPQRSRTLSRLYKDDRATSLDEFSILEKMFLDRLLTPDEVKAFSEKLADHQLAQTADGSTVLDKAVIEHNLIAASRLYENISTEKLGAILGLKASGELSAGEKAEDYAARMVEQGRLRGSLDQIDGVIYFDESVGSGGAGGDAGAGAGEVAPPPGAGGMAGRNLRRWDASVQGLAEDVERVAASISDQFPAFAASQAVR